MKINRDGSSFGWRARHSARAATTSGRSCSLARSDFYGMARPFPSIGRMLVLEERRGEPWQ